MPTPCPRTPSESAHHVDQLRARSARLARLAEKLTATGDVDGGLLALSESMDLHRRADAEINSWAERPRTARRSA